MTVTWLQRALPCFFLLVFSAGVAWAGNEPLVTTRNIVSRLIVDDKGAGRLLVQGSVTNQGDVPFRHIRLQARLLNSRGREIDRVESIRLADAHPVALSLKSPTRKREKSVNHLHQVLELGRRVDFNFYFNNVATDATSVELFLLYSSSYIPTPLKKHLLYRLHLDSAEKTGSAAEFTSQGHGSEVWHILRMGMSPEEVRRALQKSDYAPLAKGGMEPALGTLFITSFEVGKGELRLHFHDGKLFSYRSALDPSSTRMARRKVLKGLLRDFQGVLVSSGKTYVAEADRNSDEFNGEGENGVKVETQGDWVLIYHKETLTRIQRMEYQGR